jgi:hypothetical protein
MNDAMCFILFVGTDVLFAAIVKVRCVFLLPCAAGKKAMFSDLVFGMHQISSTS